MTITSHILDLSIGKPAINVETTLYKKELNNEWIYVGKDISNNDGRMNNLLNGFKLEKGIYKMIFESGKYFKEERGSLDTFYPQITIEFEVKDPLQKYHIPLLLNQFGYSTYRGS